MTKVTIMTNEGQAIIQAQEVLPGLFLHKKLLISGKPTRQLRYSLTALCGLSLYRDIRAPKWKIIQWVKKNLAGFNWETAISLSQKDKTRLIDVKADAPFPVYF